MQVTRRVIDRSAVISNALELIYVVRNMQPSSANVVLAQGVGPEMEIYTSGIQMSHGTGIRPGTLTRV